MKKFKNYITEGILNERPDSVFDSLKLINQKTKKIHDLFMKSKSTDVGEVVALAKSAKIDIENVISLMGRFEMTGDL